MSIKLKKGITKHQASLLCEWSNERGIEFQKQWMGSRVSYPLNYNKVKELDNLFSILHEESFIGVIQEVRIDKENIHIGRFIINPRRTGQGLGTEALKHFIEHIFEDEKIKTISLTVFDDNQNAKKLYEKLGFAIDEIIDYPERKYIMKKHRYVKES